MCGPLDKMVKPRISVVIPAYDEAMSIGEVVANCKAFCDQIIVVDDGSTDDTYNVATNSGAEVVRNKKNLGITKAVQRGLEAADGDIIVTLDADGQHNPTDIPKLTKPITDEKADVVLGVRDEIPNYSEKEINALTGISVRCSDTGTGFRAIRASIAEKMRLHGKCLCGTFVLEACRRRARIVEVRVKTKERIYGARKVKTRHIQQFFYVLRDLILWLPKK